VNIPFTEMDRAYIPLRGYQFALWDFGYQFEKSGIADQRKSMIIEAGLNHFFGDPAYLNADHFKAAGVRAKDKTMGSMLAYFSSPDTMLRKLFARISQFQNLLAASLILLLSQLRSRRNGMILIAYLASICFFAAFMKLERHLIVPITLCLMLAMSSQNKLINPRNSPLRLILILPWFVTFFMDFSQRKSENHNMQNRLESLQQIPENTLIYFDLYTLVKTHICLFSKPEPIQKWRSFDNAFVFLYPDWRTQFQLASANWDFYQLTTKLKSRPESVYIFHRGKQQFFSRYAEEMYNEKLHWNQISNWSEMSTGVYELQSK